jgi:uncharacterized protein (UPF0332 family)
MAFHDDLLDQADHLARRDKKRPKQANLRRAVSTAYYALFHLLVSEAVSYWRLERQRSSLARSFEHGKMKNACKNCKARDPGIQFVAAAFVDLQQFRHDADYNNSKTWTRFEVLTHIDTAGDAFLMWAIRKKPTISQEEAQDFLLSLFASDRR